MALTLVGALAPVLFLVVVLGGFSQQEQACSPAAPASGLSPAAAAVQAAVTVEFGEHTYAGVGERPDNPDSDHATGRAVDVMIENYATKTGIAEGTSIADWLRAHRTELNISYLIWRDRIWSTGNAAWRPYTHPSGGASDTHTDTQRHLDHVHVSVNGDPGTLAGPDGCATGPVTYPVPAELVGSDSHNWGLTGGMWSSVHTGTDFSTPCGTPVLASTGGVVEVDTTQPWAGSWLVKVVTGPESVATWYAHMESLAVADGQLVAAGQQLGTVGAAGNASDCHLHFEVHLENGPIYGDDNVNPSQWLADNVGQLLPGDGDGAGDVPAGAVRVATFNVLGHSHTKPGGNKPGWPSSHTRMQGAVSALDGAGIEIVGFQEFEPVQSRTFLDLTAGSWQVFPRPGTANTVNSVAWRADRWEMVRAEWVQIPYFYGNEVPMPVVLLRQVATGKQVWVGSFHNPADVRGPAQGWRDEAERRQAALAARLNRGGVPVLITGDMNDRAGYFCDTVLPAHTEAVLHASNGGQANPCRPPAGMGIDWIMGTPEIGFSGHLGDHTVQTDRIADHPLVSTYFSFN